MIKDIKRFREFGILQELNKIFELDLDINQKEEGIEIIEDIWAYDEEDSINLDINVPIGIYKV